MIRTPVVLALVALAALAGCSGGTSGSLPPHGSTVNGQGNAGNVARRPRDAATGLPAGLVCPAPTMVLQASCGLAINTTIAPIADPNTPPSLIPGWHPADLQRAYGIPGGGAGRTIAIVDAYDAPLVETDLAVYRLTFGLPPCTSQNGCFKKLNAQGQPGPYPAPNLGWAEETTLDVEIASAICPSCKLVVVEANSASIDDLGAAVDTAAGLGVAAISNSYYATEWSGEQNEDRHYQHPGIAITASSGDAGVPSYPAASANVTAVGGTTLAPSGSGFSESAWPYAGNGCSAYVGRPSWQPPACQQLRTAVDVAVVADPQSGVSMFQASSGGWLVAGGTSVGAPLVAAAYALGTPADPSFSYAHPRAFRHLAAGGFDTQTGLGAPEGVDGL